MQLAADSPVAHEDSSSSVLAELRLLRISEAGEVLGLGVSKVHQLVASGRLKSVKLDSARRIPLAALREFIASLDGRGE